MGTSRPVCVRIRSRILCRQETAWSRSLMRGRSFPQSRTQKTRNPFCPVGVRSQSPVAGTTRLNRHRIARGTRHTADRNAPIGCTAFWHRLPRTRIGVAAPDHSLRPHGESSLVFVRKERVQTATAAGQTPSRAVAGLSNGQSRAVQSTSAPVE